MVEEFQVIVSAESYILHPGQSYEGDFHKEGINENIVAVGIYYYHIDPRLRGGAVLVNQKYNDSYSICVEQGTALVFDNTFLIHRTERLSVPLTKNPTTTTAAKRKSLSFFIVNPHNKSAQDTSHVEVNHRFYYRHILSVYFPDELLDLMIDYLMSVLIVGEDQDEEEELASLKET